ncbi:cytochrome b/b6 domain-containing protein [Lysobacter enzymogenes]|uniref:cytochrome b/b6 domain-containing protein n=1 Tax=Lysobacter enzymogenes TaxID=69 RepID=UPI003CCCFF06
MAARSRIRPAARMNAPLPVPPRAPAAPGTPSRPPAALVALHWLTVAAVIAAAAVILLRGEISGRAVKQWLLDGHRHFGLLVLALLCLRIGLRLRLAATRRAAGTGPLARMERIAAAITHAALYASLLALPLLGWALSDALAKPVHLFGVALPSLVEPDPDLADALQAWHLDAAWALLALAALHAGAALWHHFVRRDEVLRNMLRARRPR